MKINTESKKYVHIRGLRSGKVLLEIGDNREGYYVTLTEQEAEKVIEMLQESITEVAQ